MKILYEVQGMILTSDITSTIDDGLQSIIHHIYVCAMIP